MIYEIQKRKINVLCKCYSVSCEFWLQWFFFFSKKVTNGIIFDNNLISDNI